MREHKFLCWGIATFGKVQTKNISLALCVERTGFLTGFGFPLGASEPHKNTMASVTHDVP